MHRTFFAAMIAAVLVLHAQTIRAAELLMFEENGCQWCERWNAEIGPIYPKTAEGKQAPLRRVDIHGTYPREIALSSRPQFTPTFVLVEGGREIGRIEGYPGEDFFWGLLGRILSKLPDSKDDQATSRRSGDS